MKKRIIGLILISALVTQNMRAQEESELTLFQRLFGRKKVSRPQTGEGEFRGRRFGAGEGPSKPGSLKFEYHPGEVKITPALQKGFRQETLGAAEPEQARLSVVQPEELVLVPQKGPQPVGLVPAGATKAFKTTQVENKGLPGTITGAVKTTVGASQIQAGRPELEVPEKKIVPPPVPPKPIKTPEQIAEQELQANPLVKVAPEKVLPEYIRGPATPSRLPLLAQPPELPPGREEAHEARIERIAQEKYGGEQKEITKGAPPLPPPVIKPAPAPKPTQRVFVARPVAGVVPTPRPIAPAPTPTQPRPVRGLRITPAPPEVLGGLRAPAGYTPVIMRGETRLMSNPRAIREAAARYNAEQRNIPAGRTEKPIASQPPVNKPKKTVRWTESTIAREVEKKPARPEQKGR